MKLLDRLADRMMDALPRRRLSVIALNAFSGGLILGALARLLGWPLVVVLLLAVLASTCVALAGQIRGWWSS